MYALCNATFPYVLQLANYGLEQAARRNRTLISAVNIRGGRVTQAAVAATFGLEHVPFEP